MSDFLEIAILVDLLLIIWLMPRSKTNNDGYSLQSFWEDYGTQIMMVTSILIAGLLFFTIVPKAVNNLDTSTQQFVLGIPSSQLLVIQLGLGGLLGLILYLMWSLLRVTK